MSDKETIQKEYGSIAEESMRISGIFDAAQAAADEYLESVKKRTAAQEERLAQIDQELAEKSESTVRRCEQMLAEAEEACQSLYIRTQAQCDDMLTNTEKLCMQREEASKAKCRDIEQSIEEKCMHLAQQTKRKCNELEQETQEEIVEKWADFADRIEKFVSAKAGLNEVIDFLIRNRPANNG